MTVPRVGRVRRDHVKLIMSPHLVVLSDCVFALRATSDWDLTSLREMLLADLSALQAEYAGGCAPYLTIGRLTHFLALRGYCCHHVSTSSSYGASVPVAHCGADVYDRATSSEHN